MQYEFAPLEGITGYIYRNAHHACFPSMDRYYTPFITPKKGKSFTTREWNDIAAEHNQNIAVVPQILANQAEGFCKVAGLVEVPCVKRNVMGAVNALTSADLTSCLLYTSPSPRD